MHTNGGMSFDEIFNIPTMALKITRCHPGIIRNKIWIAQYITIMVLSVTVISLLANSILFYDIREGKYADASKNMVMIIVSITCMFKYSILVYHQQSINKLISLIELDYNRLNSLSESEKKIVSHYIERGKKVGRLWCIISITSSTVFPVKCFSMMFYLYSKGEFKLVPMFEFTYPGSIDKHKDEVLVYCLLFAMCLSFAFFASLMYMGFDPVVPIFMLHCCGQLEVLSQRIKIIFADSPEEAKVQENLKNIVIKIQEIYRFVDVVKNNFNILYEFTMKTTTFLVPLSAFQVAECIRNRNSNLEFIPFFLGTFVHFYLPCYYSDLLMEKSEDLRQAIYACGWEKHGAVRANKTIIYMLTRASRPLVLATVFYKISLDTFAEMCRAAYAIFNFMNAAWL